MLIFHSLFFFSVYVTLPYFESIYISLYLCWFWFFFSIFKVVWWMLRAPTATHLCTLPLSLSRRLSQVLSGQWVPIWLQFEVSSLTTACSDVLMPSEQCYIPARQRRASDEFRICPWNNINIFNHEHYLLWYSFFDVNRRECNTFVWIFSDPLRISLIYPWRLSQSDIFIEIISDIRLWRFVDGESSLWDEKCSSLSDKEDLME